MDTEEMLLDASKQGTVTAKMIIEWCSPDDLRAMQTYYKECEDFFDKLECEQAAQFFHSAGMTLEYHLNSKESVGDR